MNDKLGNNLQIKDLVSFSDSSSSRMIVGSITKLTPKFVWIHSDEFPHHTFLRWYDRVVRIKP